MTELYSVLSRRVLQEDLRRHEQKLAYERDRQSLLCLIIDSCEHRHGVQKEKPMEKGISFPHPAPAATTDEKKHGPGRHAPSEWPSCGKECSGSTTLTGKPARSGNAARDGVPGGAAAPGNSTRTMARRVERRLQRSSQYTRDSDEELTFHPKILPASARIAQEKRRKENTVGMPAGEYLLLRAKAVEYYKKQKQEEAKEACSSPAITHKARQANSSASISDRLYAHAIGQQVNVACGERRPRRDVCADGEILSFHPLISERAARMTRESGRGVYDDLYDDRLRRQLQRQHSEAESLPSFHPVVDKVSKEIVRGMFEAVEMESLE
uniref:Uncharacterized protein n=1 Tax=Trypanosoma congolense (strain IL3000) TaxID=1068625 RepID=G0V0A8_TRYCI|nr:conserved hypothetical protein [Trypanosoma congolense IL3000]